MFVGCCLLIVHGQLLFLTMFGRDPLLLVFILAGISGVLWLLAIHLRRHPRAAMPARWNVSAAMVVAGALALSAAAVLFFYPMLSDDMLRYRVDGRMANAGVSPWSTTPLQWRSAPGYSFQAEGHHVDSRTPFQEIHSIYPPTAQAFFVAVDWIARRIDPRRVPGTAGTVIWSDSKGTISASAHAVMFRAGAAVWLLVSAVALLAALASLNDSPWLAVLFAWHPLVIIETAGQGHIDMLGVMFVVLAVLAALRDRHILAAILLALAAGVKPHVVLLAPVLVMSAARRRSAGADPKVGGADILFCHRVPRDAPPHLPRNTSAEKNVRPALVSLAFVAALLVVYAPILLFPANFRGWNESAQVYSAAWEANGSVYELITAPFRHGDGRSLENAKLAARLLGGVGTFLTLYLCVRNRLPLADSAYWLFLIPLLLAPVVYPWYLLWGLAMVPLLRRTGGWTMLTWAATSALSYQLLREPAWRLPPAWTLAEYLPVYAALALELFHLVAPARPRETAPAGALHSPA